MFPVSEKDEKALLRHREKLEGVPVCEGYLLASGVQAITLSLSTSVREMVMRKLDCRFLFARLRKHIKRGSMQ